MNLGPIRSAADGYGFGDDDRRGIRRFCGCAQNLPGTIEWVADSARRARGRDAKAHKSLTAVHPATPVAVLTARTIASAKTSAAIAPSAVSDTETFERPVETAMI